MLCAVSERLRRGLRLLCLHFIMGSQEKEIVYVLPFLIVVAKFLKCYYSGTCSDRFNPGKVTNTPVLEPSLWKSCDKPSHDHLALDEVVHRLVPRRALAETHFSASLKIY